MENAPEAIAWTFRIFGFQPNGERQLLDDGMSIEQATDLFISLIESCRFIALRLERENSDSGALPCDGATCLPPRKWLKKSIIKCPRPLPVSTSRKRGMFDDPARPNHFAVAGVET